MYKLKTRDYDRDESINSLSDRLLDLYENLSYICHDEINEEILYVQTQLESICDNIKEQENY